MIAYLVTYRMAHKAAYIATAFVPYAVFFFLCRDYLPGWPDGSTLLVYLVSLLLAFLIGFFFEASIGMIGFWFLEVSSFLYVVNTLSYFVSGQMFPLDLLPPFWASVLKALPFQYMAYFPTTVILGRVHGTDLWTGLAAEFVWAVVFVALACGLYRLGLRRYSAYGG
jgi:ABC-2 type transport system permease protein